MEFNRKGVLPDDLSDEAITSDADASDSEGTPASEGATPAGNQEPTAQLNAAQGSGNQPDTRGPEMVDRSVLAAATTGPAPPFRFFLEELSSRTPVAERPALRTAMCQFRDGTHDRHWLFQRIPQIVGPAIVIHALAAARRRAAKQARQAPMDFDPPTRG